MLSNSSDEIKEDEEDYISKLPDAILTQILTLLPKADANRTGILSNRWKDLWVFLPYLHFVMPICWSNEEENEYYDSVDQIVGIPVCWSTEQVNRFHDSVDQTLALRGGMPIQSFFLYCTKSCDYNRVYDWLRIVVQCKLRKLELRFPPDKYRARFRWGVFKTCDTLVELSLEGEFLLHVPKAELLFPCLKKINLVSIDTFSGYESLENLISSCPVLEELGLERQVSIDNYQTIKVSSSSLRKLKIFFNAVGFDDCLFAIDAPKLEYLYIEDYMSEDCSLKQPLSVVEAHISCAIFVDRLLTCLLAIKILTLTSSAMIGLSSRLESFRGLNMPIFPNLVKLVIAFRYNYYWNLMLLLLNSMPNLEHITFSDVIPPFSPSWNPPEEAPACLRFKMKEIILLNRKTVRQEEFIFIKYLLKHSSNLETFTINAHDIESKKREELLNFYRDSRLCRVEFV